MEIHLIVSLVSLGFFGGFSHCIGMCGPFVISQVSNNLQQSNLKDFNNFNRLKNCALLPYHLGRILTYSLIGLTSKIIIKSVDESKYYKIFSIFLLIIAIIFFIKLFCEGNNFLEKKYFLIKLFLKKYFMILFGQSKIFLLFLSWKKLRFFLTKNIISLFFIKKISKIIKLLFANPRKINGFFLGIILGFLPCGLIYGAVALALNFSSPVFTSLAMAIFGLSTFPALFFSGYFGGFILKFSQLKYIAKIVIFFNIVMLLMLTIKQILL